jgi:hypothetical protein
VKRNPAGPRLDFHNLLNQNKEDDDDISRVFA